MQLHTKITARSWEIINNMAKDFITNTLGQWVNHVMDNRGNTMWLDAEFD